MVNIVGRYEYSKRARPQVKCDPKTKEGKSRTIQSASEETNINKIMERYEKTGCLYDPLTGVGKQPMFGDVTGIGDYKEVLTRIIDLEDRFMCLPAKVRQRFSNDPFELVSFIENEQNRQEAVDLG